MLPLPCTTLPETSNLVLSCCKDLFTVHCTIRPSLYLSGLHPPRGRHFDNATYAAREYDGSSSISSPSFLSTFSRYVRSTFRRVVDRSRERKAKRKRAFPFWNTIGQGNIHPWIVASILEAWPFFVTFDPLLLDEGDVTAGNVQINGPRRVGGTGFATILRF